MRKSDKLEKTESSEKSSTGEVTPSNPKANSKGIKEDVPEKSQGREKENNEEGKNEKSENSQKGDKINKVEGNDRVERFDSVEKVDKNSKVDRLDKVDKSSLVKFDAGKQEIDKVDPRSMESDRKRKPKGGGFSAVQSQLVQLLSMPLRTSVANPFSPGFDSDLDRLRDMLTHSTAMTVLGIERAKLLTEKKPFYDVCEVANHNQVLSNLCLNAKVIGLSVQDLPSNVKIHKVIQSCKAIIGKDVGTCVKNKVHFLPLVTSSTDLFLGNCSYLDTCHKLKTCRYLHFYTLNPPPKKENDDRKPLLALEYTVGECMDTVRRPILPPQWINCDVRSLPFSILGKFAAIISDPAWDIHMTLPYGTCKDAELLSLPMAELQDEGILLLWVTGRSIEIGRKALAQWGYVVSDEIIWIKLNQLRRTIVTGRTGHWLNHSKEHLLLGIKGNPLWLNRKVDMDVIISGTRETLRKPDELYGMVDRMVGRHSRKLEIFGRDHNIRPGWFSMYIGETGNITTNTQPSATRSRARASTRERFWTSTLPSRRAGSSELPL